MTAFWDRTRYLIAPDNGSGLAISSPIETYIGTTLRTGDPMDQNADGTPDENAVTASFIGTTPGDVYAVSTPQPGTSIEFSGAKSILSPPLQSKHFASDRARATGPCDLSAGR